jgi:hypothetical protein
MIGLGLNDSAGIRLVTTVDDAGDSWVDVAAQILDAQCPLLGVAFQSYYLVVTLGGETWQMPAAAPVGQARPTAGKTEGITCPYLKESAAESGSKAPSLDYQADTVLDNLKKLERAQLMIRQAEECRRADRLDDAAAFYKQVEGLCRGSRFATLAQERLQGLRADKATEGGHAGGEEQESTSGDEPLTPEVRRDMIDLLDRCQQAVDEGRTADALQLLMRMGQLYRDNQPTGVPAQPRGRIQPRLEDHPEMEQLPAPEEQVPDSDEAMQPQLPPIDPKLVDALEKALVTSDESGRAKLIIRRIKPEASERNAAVTDAVSQWPTAAPERDMPSLFVEPDGPDETAGQESDEGADHDIRTEFAASADEWNEMLRDAIESIRAGAYSAIDEASPQRLPTLVERQVGAIRLQVVSDSDGEWSGLIVTLLPEASGDLRAVQWAHNERVLRWIISMNDRCDDQCAAEAPETQLDDDDADDDWLTCGRR